MSDSTLPPSGFDAGFVTGSKPSGRESPSAARMPADGALNKLAVAAFVLALFVGVLAPISLVMAYVAGKQIRRSAQSGAGLAKAAFVISCVYLVAGAVVAALHAFVR